MKTHPVLHERKLKVKLASGIEGLMRKQTFVSFGVLVLALGFTVAGLAQAPGSFAYPPGWKQCPRCQNNKDRVDANAKYKVDGHPFNAKDLSGVWGFNGIGFKNPPPLTDWGKQQRAKTMGDKNAKGEYLNNKDTSGEGSGSQINCDPRGWPRLHAMNYGFE